MRFLREGKFVSEILVFFWNILKFYKYENYLNVVLRDGVRYFCLFGVFIDMNNFFFVFVVKDFYVFFIYYMGLFIMG